MGLPLKWRLAGMRPRPCAERSGPGALRAVLNQLTGYKLMLDPQRVLGLSEKSLIAIRGALRRLDQQIL